VFLSFFSYQASNVKAVSKDVWDMLLTFNTTIQDDMSNFDEDGAWPVRLRRPGACCGRACLEPSASAARRAWLGDETQLGVDAW